MSDSWRRIDAGRCSAPRAQLHLNSRRVHDSIQPFDSQAGGAGGLAPEQGRDMPSRQPLQAGAAGNPNGHLPEGVSAEQLTEKNVETVTKLEKAAREQRTRTDRLAEIIATTKSGGKRSGLNSATTPSPASNAVHTASNVTAHCV